MSAEVAAVSTELDKRWIEPPQPQDLVITILADNLRRRRESVWSGGIVALLGEFGFTTGASRVALARLARRDLISRIKSGRRVDYRITERCERVLREGDDCIFRLGERHDDVDTVTVLWHTLDEAQRLERGRLARRLRFLGFGSLQDATWVAPGNREDAVVQLLDDLQITDACALMVGCGSSSLGLDLIVDRAWDLTALAERYDRFLQAFSPYSSRRARGRLSDAEAFLVRTQIIHNFRQFPALDPGLPGEFYADDRARRRSVDLFHAVYDGLTDPAHRHFDAVTQA